MRLKTLHLRKKRKLRDKFRNKIGISFKGIKIDLSQKISGEAKLLNIWLEGRAIPSSMVKGFEFTLNNNLAENKLPESGSYARRLTPMNHEISFSVDLTEQHIANIFPFLGIRTWAEPNEDGTFEHAFIHDTEDYKTFNDDMVSPYPELEAEFLD